MKMIKTAGSGGAWIILSALLMAGCFSAKKPAIPDTADQKTEADSETRLPQKPERMDAMTMNITIADQNFSAQLEDNEAAAALAEKLREKPLTLSLQDYSGFEKVGPLGFSLPADDIEIQTGPGDVVLYQGNQIVLFYGQNSWSYTKLAHVSDLDGWKNVLGSDGITVILSMEKEQ